MMTKSKGVNRKSWAWNPEQDAVLVDKYAVTKKSVLAAEIGCSVDQVLYRAARLGLESNQSVTHTGKKQSQEAKDKKRELMIHAYMDGSRQRPNEQAIKSLLLSSRRPEVVAKRAAHAGDSMRGKPQKVDGLSGASETNARAKTYTVLDGSGCAYTFTNLSHFVRQNPWLFSPDDVVWSGPTNNPSCRAKVGLGSLFRQKRPSKSWKGWTAVSKTKKPADF